MVTEVLTRDQVLTDIAAAPVTARVTKPIECTDSYPFTDIELTLPHDCQLMACISEVEGRRSLNADDLKVNRLARNAGVASRLIRGLAYLAAKEEVNYFNVNITSPHALRAIRTLLGNDRLICVQYKNHEDVRLPSADYAIAMLESQSAMDIDVTAYVGDGAWIETEEPLIQESYESQ